MHSVRKRDTHFRATRTWPDFDSWSRMGLDWVAELELSDIYSALVRHVFGK